MLQKYQFEILLVLNLGIGVAIGFYPIIALFVFLYIFFVKGIFPIIHNRDAKGHTHLAAAYIAAFEMTIRASKAPFYHETSKYSVMLLLFLSMLAESNNKRKIPLSIIFFMLLLIPSVFLMDDNLEAELIRQYISFNLSGPFCLAVSTIYYFNRSINFNDIIRLFQTILLAMATTLGLLFVKTPSLSEIEFNYGANAAASVYGPNQMASTLGFGVLLLIIAFLMNLQVFKFKTLLWILFGLFIFRGLLTFSRGGLFGPALSIILGLFYYFTKTQSLNKNKIKLILLFIIGFLIVKQVFNYVNEISENKLYERYTGKRADKDVDIDEYSSGRTKIMRIDLEIFQDYPILGIGVGMGLMKRYDYGYGENVAAHVEFSRLLAEHGILGLFALLILIGLPLNEFIKRRNRPDLNFLLISFVLSTFTFMFHSATRIALPMFMYGLAFAYFQFKPNYGVK